MMRYLGAPISLGFRAGKGAATLRSKDGHGPQPAGAAEKKREEDEAGQQGKQSGQQTHNHFHGQVFCRTGNRAGEGKDLLGVPCWVSGWDWSPGLDRGAAGLHSSYWSKGKLEGCSVGGGEQAPLFTSERRGVGLGHERLLRLRGDTVRGWRYP